MTKKRSILGSLRVVLLTAALVLSSLGLYAQSLDVRDRIPIHLTCSISVCYSGVIVDGVPIHLSCTICERYTGIIVDVVNQPGLLE